MVAVSGSLVSVAGSLVWVPGSLVVLVSGVEVDDVVVVVDDDVETVDSVVGSGLVEVVESGSEEDVVDWVVVDVEVGGGLGALADR